MPNVTAEGGPPAKKSEELAFEREKLRFERQKLALDIKLKRRELATRRSGLRETLANPLSLALVGGFLALLTSMVTSCFTANAARDADDRRAKLARESEARALQSELIKSFLQTSESKTARENLTFLIEAGLLPDYEKRIGDYLRQNARAAPRLSDGDVMESDSSCQPLWDKVMRAGNDPSSPIGLSLHIAANRFAPRVSERSEQPVVNAVSDANAMAGLAYRKGFATRVLVDTHARADCVLDAIGQASSQLKAGDIFLLTISGHGAQVADPLSDEADHLQEAWVVYDRLLLEDEVQRAMAGFAAGVRVVIVEDCSHGMVLRQAPKIPPRNSRLPQQLSRVPIKADILILAASAENQIARDGPANGLFTAALLEVWSNGAFAGSYQELVERVAGKLSPVQKPSLYGYGPNANLRLQRAFSIRD